MDMNDMVDKVLNTAVEEGLTRGILHYSSLISQAPKKRIWVNVYNKYGQKSEINKSYSKELTVWKKTKLFPFFLEHGYTKEQITEAYNKSVFKK